MRLGFNIHYTACSDEALMKYVEARDSRAFEVLYDRYSKSIYRFLYRMLWQNAALAEDLTQDIFLKIIEKPQLFKQQGTFKSWIYTVARNKCKNAFRDKKKSEGIELLEGMDDSSEQTNSIDQQYFEESLQSTIEKLDLNSKECFVLRFVEGLSIREIAEILQIPEGTVKSRLHFATKKVAAQMKNLKEIFE